MERLTNSSSASTDFEFKYIPKKEFERLVTRVERERKLKDKRMWGGFCSVTSANDEDDDFGSSLIRSKKKGDDKAMKALKVLTDDDIQSVMQSLDKQEISRSIPSSQAPFFAAPIRLSVAKLEEQNLESFCGEDSSETSSVHIAETVNLTQQAADAKFEVQNQTDDDAASARSSLDEKESLQSEILKLCSEIRYASGKVSSSSTLSDDLTHQEEKNSMKNIVDKTEEKTNCDKYNKLIDEEFDFLFEKCKNSIDFFDENEDERTRAQTLPVVELRQKASKTMKVTSDEEFTNENNVWIPQMQNQIRKSGREHEKSSVKKKRNDGVFPGDVNIREAREVGKLKRDVNEKSQVDVTTLNNKKDGKHHQRNHDGNSRDVRAPPRTDVMYVLGKITQYQEKICQHLDYLREIIEDPPEVEDMNDLKKRQKRATEFSSRFARNHLYQIGRIAEEIRLMPDNPSDVAEKANFLFQVIMQAVQSYLKTVEMFIYNNCPDKLVVLIDFVINAMKICFDRKVFDKRDLVIQKMMRKCVEMKHYLEMNQQSFAKFASIQEKRKMSLSSRSSFAFESPYGAKLSMYEDLSSMKKQSKQRKNLPSKSPYDVTKPRDVQCTNSRTGARSRVAQSRNNRVQPQVNSSKIRKSSSNISTAVQQMKNCESENDIKLLSERPLEDFNPITQATLGRPMEMEFMEILKSMSQKAIQDCLAPFLAEINSKVNIQQTSPEAKNTEEEKVSATFEKLLPSPRVTSDVTNRKKEKVKQEEVKPNNIDRVEQVASNIQYLYVKSDGDSVKDVGQPQLEANFSKRDLKSSGDHLPEVTSHSEPRMKVVGMKPWPVETLRPNSEFLKELKEQALKDRLKYVEKMMENPLYSNEAHNEPWKMFAKISDKILDEMLNEVIGEWDFGEKVFIDKFLKHELQC